jgi:hypothetical protein
VAPIILCAPYLELLNVGFGHRLLEEGMECFFKKIDCKTCKILLFEMERNIFFALYPIGLENLENKYLIM